MADLGRNSEARKMFGVGAGVSVEPERLKGSIPNGSGISYSADWFACCGVD